MTGIHGNDYDHGSKAADVDNGAIHANHTDAVGDGFHRAARAAEAAAAEAAVARESVSSRRIGEFLRQALIGVGP